MPDATADVDDVVDDDVIAAAAAAGSQRMVSHPSALYNRT